MQTLFKKKPEFTMVDPLKLAYNVGCLFDIPGGEYVKGEKGENILNGGVTLFMAVVGRANTFKTVITDYFVLAAANTVANSGIWPYINYYDTEINTSVNRKISLSKKMNKFQDVDIVDEGVLVVTDKTKHQGNEWYKITKDFLRNEKLKNAKQYTLKTPMLSNKGEPIYSLFPTFGAVDSLTEFSTDATEEIQNKNEIGDSGGNTIHARSGLDKTRLLMELPVLCHSTMHFMVMTAHVGKDIQMGGGPPGVQPPKTLQHMAPGDKIKGVADKFFFLTTTMFQTRSSSVLNNQGTKGPEFPRVQGDDEAGSTDLNAVTMKLLRSKTGLSGINITVLVSQKEGVLPTLTEFYYLKENGKYGFEGNDRSFNMILLPEVSMMRTTVREKIDSTPELRRAIKILADLKQISIYQRHLPQITDLKDFYEKLEAKYGWKTLLNTRDFWTFNNYDHPVPFLSTLDMIEMYYDRYTPYWWTGEKK